MMMSHLIDLAKQNQSADPTFIPTVGSEEELVEAALVAALNDRTPMGLTVLQAARRRLSILRRSEGKKVESDQELRRLVLERNAFVKEGTIDSIEKWVRGFGGMIHNHLRRVVSQTQVRGGQAVVVASEKADLGVVCFRGGRRFAIHPSPHP